MKKAFDQTVRDLKREVNKKVLKLPSVEQKILDATSNEPWGPHGSLLADIAQATRNHYEYQMIMNVIWKRINDTGKNWRHVYKALTVLEYLVAHGSERVIDEIKEHAYQISTLSDFQYIDSSGRDQGNNVRRKSQSLVSLVNDKERIQEVRQKAAANRDKYCSTFSTRPGSYPSLGGFGDRYDDDRYENRYSSREEDRYGHGRERDWGYRDDDRSSRGGDSYGRDGDRYGRYSDERLGRDGHRDDDYRGRGNDDYQYGSRARSLSRDRSYDDDERSTRSGGGRAADDPPRDERQLDRKLSGQNISAPPSYEEATKDAPGRVQEEKYDLNEGEFTAAAASKTRLPPAHPSENTNQGPSPFVPAGNSPKGTHQDSDYVPVGASVVANSNDNNGFAEFDPRGSIQATPPASSSLEKDLFGAGIDSVYSLALVPISMNDTGPEADISENSGFARSSFDGFSQPDGNPFGDPPFKASHEPIPYQQQSFVPAASFNASISTGAAETLPPATSSIQTASTFDFDGSFGGVSFTSASDGGQSSFATPVILPSEAPFTQSSNNVSGMFGPQTGSTAFVPPQETQPVGPTHSQGNLFLQSGPTASFDSQAPQLNAQAPHFSAQVHPVAQVNMQTTTQLNLLSKPSAQASTTMEMTAPASNLTHVKSTSSKEKFEAKSTVWADTLNRGLVNLNISGPKINPHADIGVDFDSINRKDRMKEERKAPALVSTTSMMGKAMGAGSGMGRAGAGTFTAPSNPMMAAGMGMGMGMPGSGGMKMGTMGGGMGMGIGIGTPGYGGNMGRPMGMGMNMGTNLGMPPQRPIGAPPGGSGVPGYGYNPMTGGNYGSQQPYGGGYR